MKGYWGAFSYSLDLRAILKIELFFFLARA